MLLCLCFFPRDFVHSRLGVNAAVQAEPLAKLAQRAIRDLIRHKVRKIRRESIEHVNIVAVLIL